MAVTLKPCGTTAAYMRHKRAGEEVCDRCRKAWNAYRRSENTPAPAPAPEPVVEEVEQVEQEDLTHWETGTGTITPCQMDPDAWFPKKGGSAATAKKFCAACPARDACLQVAMDLERGLEMSSRHGVWGSLGPRERAELDPTAGTRHEHEEQEAA